MNQDQVAAIYHANLSHAPDSSLRPVPGRCCWVCAIWYYNGSMVPSGLLYTSETSEWWCFHFQATVFMSAYSPAPESWPVGLHALKKKRKRVGKDYVPPRTTWTLPDAEKITDFLEVIKGRRRHGRVTIIGFYHHCQYDFTSQQHIMQDKNTVEAKLVRGSCWR